MEVLRYAKSGVDIEESKDWFCNLTIKIYVQILERKARESKRQEAPSPRVGGEGKKEPDQKLLDRVQEIQQRLEQKKRARAKFDSYIAERHTQGMEIGTDYVKWDMWCPEDEDDEMLAGCTPNNPQFHAMEKDINTRHDR